MKISKCVNFIAPLLFISLIACSGMDSGKATKDNGALYAAIKVSPVSLDPRMASDSEGYKISHLISDGLTAFNEKMEIIPELAERYEMIGDRSYRFYLRKGVKFHSGASLTAKDVIYTYQSILDGKVISVFKESFSRVEKMVAEDDYTVRIDLLEPYAPFLTLVTMGIIPEGEVGRISDEEFGKKPVGTGPYKLIKFIPEQVVELEANPDYFGNIPKVKRLVLDVVKDDNIRVLKLMKGDIDLVQSGIPFLLLPKLQENKDLKIASVEGLGMTYLGLNLTEDKLKDRRVREAIAYAIDRDEIINHRYVGMATLSNSVLPPSNWAYPTGLKQYEYDPKKATELLDQAGFRSDPKTGERLSLLYKTSNAKERIDIANMIAYQLGKVGINVRVEPYEWGTFYRDVKTGNFQLYSLSWLSVTEPDFLYNLAHTSQMPPDGSNRSRYSNPIVDELVEGGRITLDENKRKIFYEKIQRILIEDLPYVPLWHEKDVIVYRGSLGGVKIAPGAGYRTFVDVYK